MEEICEICGKDIKLVDGCVESEIEIGGKWHKMLMEPVHEVNPNECCHDCGVESGRYHRWDCEMEKCPKCGGQLIFCICRVNYVRAV